MLIHLADALSGKTGTTHVEVPLESSRFKMADGISYALKNVSPIEFAITYKEDRNVWIEAKISLVCTAPCSRCLKEVEVPLSFEIEREIDFKETDQQRKEALDEMNFLHDFDLDTEILLHEEIMMNFPSQVLCREDCKGLCPQCGINRNEGHCSCDEAPKDPRMAAIQELFRQSVLENSK